MKFGSHYSEIKKKQQIIILKRKLFLMQVQNADFSIIFFGPWDWDLPMILNTDIAARQAHQIAGRKIRNIKCAKPILVYKALYWRKDHIIFDYMVSKEVFQHENPCYYA